MLGSLVTALPINILPLRVATAGALMLAAAGAAPIAWATAQIKPTNSRATAVMAMFLSLPLLSSAR